MSQPLKYSFQNDLQKCPVENGFLLHCLSKVDFLFIIIKVCKLEYGAELTLNLLTRGRGLRVAGKIVRKCPLRT
jgi:hypothetical protein